MDSFLKSSLRYFTIISTLVVLNTFGALIILIKYQVDAKKT